MNTISGEPCGDCAYPQLCAKEKRCNYAPAFMNQAKILKKLFVRWQEEKSPEMMDSKEWESDQSVDPSSYDRILIRAAFARCTDPFFLMSQMYHVCKPGGLLVIDWHYGSSDQGDGLREKRRIWADTMRTFEPRWKFKSRIFYLDKFFFGGREEAEQIGAAVANLRNVTKGFAVELVCQKPVPEGYEASDPVTAFKFI